jgi:hypothetical protein
MRNILLLLVIGLLLFITSGCTGHLIAYYSPSIILEGKGNVTVEKFNYITDKHNVKPNQLYMGGLTALYFDQNIDEYVTDAVKKELKFIGYSLSGTTGKVIGGEIMDFSINSWGFSIDYILRIKFIIKVIEGDQEKLLYSKIHEGTEHLSKLQELQGSIGPDIKIQKILSKAIESFIKDAQNEKLL